VEWIGYKVHFIETCDEDRPNLIVNVETRPATTPDDKMIEQVHESLERNERLRPVSSNGAESWNRMVIRRVFPGLRGRNRAVFPRILPELDV
jgi:hypothetical protein